MSGVAVLLGAELQLLARDGVVPREAVQAVGEARDVLVQARGQADLLQAQVQAEMASLRERVRQELADLREQAQVELAALREQAAGQARVQAEAEIAHLLAQARGERMRLVAALGDQLVDACVRTVRALCLGPLNEALHHVLLERLHRETAHLAGVVLKVPPEQLPALREAMDGMDRAATWLLRIEADPALQAGECRAVTPEGTVGLRLEDALQRLLPPACEVLPAAQEASGA